MHKIVFSFYFTLLWVCLFKNTIEKYIPIFYFTSVCVCVCSLFTVNIYSTSQVWQTKKNYFFTHFILKYTHSHNRIALTLKHTQKQTKKS